MLNLQPLEISSVYVAFRLVPQFVDVLVAVLRKTPGVALRCVDLGYVGSGKLLFDLSTLEP